MWGKLGIGGDELHPYMRPQQGLVRSTSQFLGDALAVMAESAAQAAEGAVEGAVDVASRAGDVASRAGDVASRAGEVASRAGEVALDAATRRTSDVGVVPPPRLVDATATRAEDARL